MQLEAARLVQAALGHGTYGVNAKIAALSYDGGDPAIAAFDPANVVDESTDPRAALRFPESDDGVEATLYPALLVHAPEVRWKDGEWAQRTQSMFGDVVTQVRLALNLADPAAAVRETYYRLTAVEQCLRSFFLALETDGTRNNVRLISLIRLERLALTNDRRDALVTGGVQATWSAVTIDPT